MSASSVKVVLYLGTDPYQPQPGSIVWHYPVIHLVPRTNDAIASQLCWQELSTFTHYLFTSKHAVRIFCDLCEFNGVHVPYLLQNRCISIGPMTSRMLQQRGVFPLWEAKRSQQEGIIEEMQRYDWTGARLLYPRSSSARSLLSTYLQNIDHCIVDLYDTVYHVPGPLPPLEHVQEIIFTSPSTVEGFFRICAFIPSHIHVRFQGVITENAFMKKYGIQEVSS